jgi:hypothetical protein
LHLSGIEQAVWIGLSLEAQLIGVRTLMGAAPFQSYDMGIGDGDPNRFVDCDDLVKPFYCREAEKRKRTRRNPAAKAKEFEVLHKLRAEQVCDLAQCRDRPVEGQEALQISYRPIALQNMQRGVIPGVFVKRGPAWSVVALGLQMAASQA